MSIKKLNMMLDTLNQAATSLQDEAESWKALVDFWNVYEGSEEFMESLKEEIEIQYERLVNNYTEVDVKITRWVPNDELEAD